MKLKINKPFGLLAFFCLIWGYLPANAQTNSAPAHVDCVVLTVEGKVEVVRKGATEWAAVSTNQVLNVGDRLRTGLRSRATLKWSDLSVVRVNQLTSMELTAPEKPGGKTQLDLKSGATYLFSREKPEEIQFRTPVASGAIRGTEFNLAVADDGRTELALLDGEVDLKNSQGAVTLKSGEQGTVEQGRAPAKTAVLDAMSTIQWALYYPAVVDPDETGLSQSERDDLKDSLHAYREGDLLAALKKYPEGREPATEAERVFHAALLLSVGQVEQTEADLKEVKSASSPANAIREVINVVKGRAQENLLAPTSASENLARSYTLQSRSQLQEALTAAREATKKSPSLGATWIRAAELEFSLGNTREALTSLNKGLDLSPRNAQGSVLKGFVLSARGRTREAMNSFDQAVAADGALANAWLGRGLLKIRNGESRAGREDLQVAATLEPQRAGLRSYLGKAFANAGDQAHAEKELGLAKKLDPNDPTAWLYSALLHQEENRINEAAEDLEKSKELNGNRSVFRSQLLLDQDQAVRSANLASIYGDLGMYDVSVQEASSAVNSDYANASAHQFLASSYDAIRDPKLINLRYETPAYSEYLMANLLAPAGSGGLAQNISQQEYSRFFDAPHFGVFSDTEYNSNGDWSQSASQYGYFGDTSYSLDGYYRWDNGFRPNNDLELWNFGGRVKHELTPQDGLYLEVSTLHLQSGDVAQYYDQSEASPTQRVREEQTPNILLGYHHEWSPGSHTLFLGGRFSDTLEIEDANNTGLLFLRPPTFFDPIFRVVNPAFFSSDYRRELDVYSAELQQAWQNASHTVVVGGRYQTASPDTDSALVRDFGGPTTITDQSIDTDFYRVSLYCYDYWQILDELQITTGVSYDKLHYPKNIDTAPITDDETSTDRVSPKVGIRWTPWTDTQFRGVYTRSLGGFSFDQSVRLEPTQIAGFNQAFRSLIPESVAGFVPGTRFETFGLGWNQKFNTRTYVVVEGQYLKSDAKRTVGLLESSTGNPIPDTASSTSQTLDYKEKTLSVTVNQLLADELAVGVRYRLTHADLEGRFVDIAETTPGVPNQDVSATLHQVSLYGIYNHPCGFFAQVNGIWSGQANHGYSGTKPGDDFWQVNVLAGYRFWNRRAEAHVGVLNVGDTDYKLNPLSLYNELPRERLFVAGLRISF